MLYVAAFAFVTAGVYAFVGDRVAPLSVRTSAGVARALFTTWWTALAASTALNGILAVAAVTGQLTLVAVVLVSQVNLLLICVALWGLLYYLLYVFVGRERLLPIVSVGYLALYLFLVYTTISNQPIGFTVGRWSVTVDYAREIEGPLLAIILSLIIIPQILGSIALLVLVLRGGERSQRYRISLVSLSILFWFGTAFIASLIGLGQGDTYQIVIKAIALFAAFMVLAAYRPPSWVRRTFNIQPIPDE